jgi:phospholipase/carboxylesterase
LTLDLGFVHRFEPGSGDLTLLLLHGTGGDENDLIPLGRQLAPEANLLSPRGQVLENGMPRFFRRIAMGVFDEEDLRRRTVDLADFVERAVNHYGLKRSDLVALGYSNGANIAASMLFLRPGTVSRAALLHAMVPFELDEERPDLSGTSVLVTGGRQDPLVPREQTERLAEMLSACGADVLLGLQPGGHELTYQELDAVGSWLGAGGPGALPGHH